MADVNKILENLSKELNNGIAPAIEYILKKIQELNSFMESTDKVFSKALPDTIKDLNAVSTAVNSITREFKKVDTSNMSTLDVAKIVAKIDDLNSKLLELHKNFAFKATFAEGNSSLEQAITQLARYQHEINKLSLLQSEYYKRLEQLPSFEGVESFQDFFDKSTRSSEEARIKLSEFAKEGETLLQTATRVKDSINEIFQVTGDANSMREVGTIVKELKASFEDFADGSKQWQVQMPKLPEGLEKMEGLREALLVLEAFSAWQKDYNNTVQSDVVPGLKDYDKSLKNLVELINKYKTSLDELTKQNPQLASGNLEQFIDEGIKALDDRKAIEKLRDLNSEVANFVESWARSSQKVRESSLPQELTALEAKLKGITIGVGKPEEVAKQQKLYEAISLSLENYKSKVADFNREQQKSNTTDSESINLYQRLVEQVKNRTASVNENKEALQQLQMLIVSLSNTEQGSVFTEGGEVSTSQGATNDKLLEDLKTRRAELEAIAAQIEANQQVELNALSTKEKEILLLEELRQSYVKLEAIRRGFKTDATGLTDTSNLLQTEHAGSKGPHPYMTDEQIKAVALGTAESKSYAEALALVKSAIDNMSESERRARQDIEELNSTLKDSKASIDTNLYASIDKAEEAIAKGAASISDYQRVLKSLESDRNIVPESDIDNLKRLNETIEQVKDKIKELKEAKLKEALGGDGGLQVDLEAIMMYDDAIAKSREELEARNVVLRNSINEKISIKEKTEKTKMALEQETKELRINKAVIQDLVREEKNRNKAKKEAADAAKKTKYGQEELRGAIKQLAKEVKAGTISYEEANEKLAKFKRTVDSMPMSVQNGLEGPLRKATKELAKYKDAQSTTLSGLDKVLKTVTTRFGYFLTSGVMIFKALKAIGDGIKAVIKYSLEFEKALANLNAIVQPTGTEFTKLEYSIRKASLGTTQSLKQVADTATVIAKLGYTATEISKMIEPVTNFTQATNESTEAVGELLGSTLRVFQLDFRKSTEVMDLFAKSMNISAISFKYLQTSMKIVGPVANSLNLSLKDTLVYLGVLANAGLDASRGATALRNIMLHLTDANGKLAKSLGYVVKDAETFKKALSDLTKMNINLADSLELTDKRSVAAFNRFLVAQAEVDELSSKLEDVSGTLEKMREDQLKATITSWDALGISVNNFFAYIIGGTPKVAAFFKKMREGLDDTTYYMSLMEGVEPSGGTLGISGLQPQYKEPTTTINSEDTKPKTLIGTWLHERQKSKQQVSTLKRRVATDRVTWEAFSEDFIDQSVSDVIELNNALRNATDKTYKQVFKDLQGFDIEEFLKDDKAHQENVKRGLTSDWVVVVDDAIQKIGKDRLKELQESLKVDEEKLKKLLMNLDFKDGGRVDISKHVTKSGNLNIEQFVRDLNDLSKTSVDVLNMRMSPQLLGEAISRLTSYNQISKDIKGLMTIEAKGDDPYKAERERWKKFMEKVSSDELKALAAMDKNRLQDEAKFYERVAKNTKQLSDVRLAASKNWFAKEAQLVAANLESEKVNHKEQAKQQWAQAKDISEVKGAALKEFESWYEKNYIKSLEAIDQKHALEYEVLYQKVLQNRMSIEQASQKKLSEIRKQNLDEAIKGLQELSKATKEQADHQLKLDAKSKKSGLGFLFFTEAESTTMAFDVEVLKMQEGLTAATSKRNLLLKEEAEMRTILDELNKKQLDTDEERNKVYDSLNKALKEGLITEESHTVLMSTLVDIQKDGALSIEEIEKRMAEFTKEANLSVQEVELLELALKRLKELKPVFYGDWGQEMTKGQKKFLEQYKNVASPVMNVVNELADVFTMFYENKLNDLEYYYQKEAELIDKNHSKEMDSLEETKKKIQDNKTQGLLSEAEAAAQARLLDIQKEQKEKQYQADKEKREEEYEKKKNALEVKAAKWRKATAIMDATNAAAVAVINALALPVPLNFIMMGIVGGLAAAKIAAIAAQPLPRYAKGTGFHPGGPAVVGDGGKHEVIISPSTSTIMDLPRGAKVFPDVESFLLSRFATSQSSDSRVDHTFITDPELRALTSEGNSELSKMNRTLQVLRANDRYFIQESIRANITNKYK